MTFVAAILGCDKAGIIKCGWFCETYDEAEKSFNEGRTTRKDLDWKLFKLIELESQTSFLQSDSIIEPH